MTKSHKDMPLNTGTQCYAAGKRAFNQGAAITDNPCSRGTWGHSQWRNGWYERCEAKTPEAFRPAMAAEKAHEAAQDAAHEAAMRVKYKHLYEG